jgi:hypothetical protein
LRLLARSLTWWTVGIESAVAVAFLFPITSPDVRVWLLLVFVLSTFVFVPVPSFGQLLLLLLYAIVSSGPWHGPLVVLIFTLGVVAFLPEMATRVIGHLQMTGREGARSLASHNGAR